MADPFHDVYETLGEHTAQLAGLKGTCDGLKGTCVEINAKLDQLLTDKYREEGGRKMFYTIAAALGSAAGAAGAAVAAFIRS